MNKLKKVRLYCYHGQWFKFWIDLTIPEQTKELEVYKMGRKEIKRMNRNYLPSDRVNSFKMNKKLYDL
jgi:hypothetical protein